MFWLKLHISVNISVHSRRIDEQTTTNHETDHYKWWHESSQITTNHHKPWHKPPCLLWQKPGQSMTWITTNHHKPWHEPSWWPKKSSAWSHMASLFKSCGKFKKHMTTVNFAFTLFTTEVTLKIAQNKYAIFSKNVKHDDRKKKYYLKEIKGFFFVQLCERILLVTNLTVNHN